MKPVPAVEPKAFEPAAAAPQPAASRSAAPRTAARRRVASPPVPTNGHEPSASTSAPAVVAAAPRVVTDEDIRVRAYFLALEHGGSGSDVDFWLLAERELRPQGSSQE